MIRRRPKAVWKHCCLTCQKSLTTNVKTHESSGFNSRVYSGENVTWARALKHRVCGSGCGWCFVCCHCREFWSSIGSPLRLLLGILDLILDITFFSVSFVFFCRDVYVRFLCLHFVFFSQRSWRAVAQIRRPYEDKPYQVLWIEFKNVTWIQETGSTKTQNVCFYTAVWILFGTNDLSFLIGKHGQMRMKSTRRKSMTEPPCLPQSQILDLSSESSAKWNWNCLSSRVSQIPIPKPTPVLEPHVMQSLHSSIYRVYRLSWKNVQRTCKYIVHSTYIYIYIYIIFYVIKLYYFKLYIYILFYDIILYYIVLHYVILNDIYIYIILCIYFIYIYIIVLNICLLYIYDIIYIYRYISISI